MIEHDTRAAALVNLEMQIFKSFLIPHGQPLSLQVKLYQLQASRKKIKIITARLSNYSNYAFLYF